MMLSEITRLEVISEKGRDYVNMNCSIEGSIQDNGKTLKIFVTNRSLNNFWDKWVKRG